MTDLEQYLFGYTTHLRSIQELQYELIAAKRVYDDAVGLSPPVLTIVKSDARKIHNPTMDAGIMLAEDLGAEVQRIGHALDIERMQLSAIENLVDGSPLNAKERAYVRYRYYEGRSNEYMCGKMYCSVPTLLRIRLKALGKIEKVQGEKKKRGCS